MSLREAIERTVLAFPGYGYRRVTKALAREGWAVNHKRVLRLLRQESLFCQPKRRFVATADSGHAQGTYPIHSGDYVAKLEATRARISIMAVGTPFENANAEGFFKTFKREKVFCRSSGRLLRPRPSPAASLMTSTIPSGCDRAWDSCRRQRARRVGRSGPEGEHAVAPRERRAGPAARRRV